MTEYFLFGGRRFVPETAAPPAGIPLPAGNFARILHDDEALDGKMRIGFPEVVPLKIVEYTDLTEAWQRFWFAQLIHSYTGFVHWDPARLSPTELEMLKREWRSLTHQGKAFTNNFGTDNCRDYISGRNSGLGLPKQGAIACGGAPVKVLGGNTVKGVPVETLDGTRPPPPVEKVNRITTPWLVFAATNVAADKTDPKNWKPVIVTVDGKPRHRVDPFPNLGTKDTPVPLRSNGRKTGETYTRDGINLAVNWLPANRLVKVSAVVPRPYVP